MEPDSGLTKDENRQPLTREEIRFVATRDIWRELCRVFRYLIFAVAICYCITSIGDDVVAVLTADRPWWEAVLAAIAPLIAVVGTAVALIGKRARAVIKRLGTRNAMLELEKDPTRSSSDLREDGTLPDD